MRPETAVSLSVPPAFGKARERKAEKGASARRNFVRRMWAFQFPGRRESAAPGLSACEKGALGKSAPFFHAVMLSFRGIRGSPAHVVQHGPRFLTPRRKPGALIPGGRLPKKRQEVMLSS